MAWDKKRRVHRPGRPVLGRSGGLVLLRARDKIT